ARPASARATPPAAGGRPAAPAPCRDSGTRPCAPRPRSSRRRSFQHVLAQRLVGLDGAAGAAADQPVSLAGRDPRIEPRVGPLEGEYLGGEDRAARDEPAGHRETRHRPVIALRPLALAGQAVAGRALPLA